MPELTEKQIEAQNKAKDAAAAQAKVRAENKARRDSYRANIGKTFTDGDVEATITGFDKEHLIGDVRDESFIVHYGNPNCQHFVHCKSFLNTFQLKGEVS